MPRRIDDHSFWAGKGSEDSVLPVGMKMKSQDNVEGAGDLNKYEDTSEAIEKAQKRSVSQADRHDMKDGDRY